MLLNSLFLFQFCSFSFMNLFSGFMIPAASMGWWWRWFIYINVSANELSFLRIFSCKIIPHYLSHRISSVDLTSSFITLIKSADHNLFLQFYYFAACFLDTLCSLGLSIGQCSGYYHRLQWRDCHRRCFHGTTFRI